MATAEGQTGRSDTRAAARGRADAQPRHGFAVSGQALHDIGRIGVLLEVLGGPEAGEGVAIPVWLGDTPAMVFYGDNAPDNASSGSLEDLTRIFRKAGEALSLKALEESPRELTPSS